MSVVTVSEDFYSIFLFTLHMKFFWLQPKMDLTDKLFNHKSGLDSKILNTGKLFF